MPDTLVCVTAAAPRCRDRSRPKERVDERVAAPSWPAPGLGRAAAPHLQVWVLAVGIEFFRLM